MEDNAIIMNDAMVILLLTELNHTIQQLNECRRLKPKARKLKGHTMQYYSDKLCNLSNKLDDLV